MSLFLRSKNVIVKSAEEALWVLMGKQRVEGNELSEDGRGRELSDIQELHQPPTVQRTARIQPPLHALIIGIDRYLSKRVSNLRGCVADADAVAEYLQTELSVPANQVTNLRNDQATRAGIIKAIQDLIDSRDVGHGDPILIFYAGHGASKRAPTGWSTSTGMISMIIPHDCKKPGPDGRKVHGIHDRLLGSLFSKLAEKKGDNITVIFDCCFSGGGTRKSFYEPTRLVRGISYEDDLPDDLDEDLLGKHDATRAAAPQKVAVGLASHVLLAACQSDEVAGEERGRGLFSQALLETLKAVGAEKVTYLDLRRRLPDLPGQNPQFEGANIDRLLFDARAPSRDRALFRINQVDGSYVLEAGSAHGITAGAVFSVYSTRNFLSSDDPLGTLVASAPAAFTTTMSLVSTQSAPFDIPDRAGYALQVSASQDEALRLHVPLQQGLLAVFEAIAAELNAPTPGKRAILLVEQDRADLSVTLADDGQSIEYLLPSTMITRYGLTRLYHTSPPQPPAIRRVLQAAAHFFWHLRRSPEQGLLRHKVDIELQVLESTGELNFDVDHFDDMEVYQPVGDNLIQEGVVDVEVVGEIGPNKVAKNFESATVYGLTLRSKTPDIPLYVGLFYFDCSELSISEYYASPATGPRAEPSLPANGILPIGYGDGGGRPYNYYLRQGQDLDVGFLRLFLSVEPIHFSGIAQQSPFELNSRQFRAEAEPLWDAVTIAVVQRKPGTKIEAPVDTE
ncbi:unnamed protein product [Peniophora sp. CBMAI 1063]|nr:unnamed protein product [Peniophora sp. CBMAI 1063]